LPYRRSISTTASRTRWSAVSNAERQNSGYDCSGSIGDDSSMAGQLGVS
jgi:hypothetical protein